MNGGRPHPHANARNLVKILTLSSNPRREDPWIKNCPVWSQRQACLLSVESKTDLRFPGEGPVLDTQLLQGN